MAYDEEASDFIPPMPPERMRYVVDLLRSWVGQKFRHRLPPVREDQAVALTELLKLMIRECPADLAMLQDLEREAMAELPMTEEEIAMSHFVVHAIDLAFAARAAGQCG